MSDNTDKRAYLRRKLALLARFITNSGRESAGRLQDISEGGLFMETSSSVAVGDEVIIYPEGLGRLTGRIVRKSQGGVAVEFELTAVQKEYLSKRIASAEAGTPYLKLMEQRAHRRIDMKVESRAVIQDAGLEFDCTIIDLSITGALIRSDLKPPLGTEVRIGTLRGHVKRHWDEGFAIQFLSVAAA